MIEEYLARCCCALLLLLRTTCVHTVDLHSKALFIAVDFSQRITSNYVLALAKPCWTKVQILNFILNRQLKQTAIIFLGIKCLQYVRAWQPTVQAKDSSTAPKHFLYSLCSRLSSMFHHLYSSVFNTLRIKKSASSTM